MTQLCSNACTASGAVPSPPRTAEPGPSPPEVGRKGADSAVDGDATLQRSKGKHKRKKSHKASKKHRDHPPSEPSPLLPKLASRVEIDPPQLGSRPRGSAAPLTGRVRIVGRWMLPPQLVSLPFCMLPL